MPSSSGMVNRARFASPSPRQREKSWIEYLEPSMARTIRSIRGAAPLPDSLAERGTKPQLVTVKTIAWRIGVNAPSKGQLMKTQARGSSIRQLGSPIADGTPVVLLQRLHMLHETFKLGEAGRQRGSVPRLVGLRGRPRGFPQEGENKVGSRTNPSHSSGNAQRLPLSQEGRDLGIANLDRI